MPFCFDVNTENSFLRDLILNVILSSCITLTLRRINVTNVYSKLSLDNVISIGIKYIVAANFHLTGDY